MSRHNNNNNSNPSTPDEEEEEWDDAKQTNDDDISSGMARVKVSSSVAPAPLTAQHKTSADQSLVSGQNKVISSLATLNKDDESSSLILHRAIFENNESILEAIFRSEALAKTLVSFKDKHGNTPLHLACMLGRPKTIVERLIQLGGSIETRNLQRWTPFHEACSYGNRDVVRLMTQQLKKDAVNKLNQHVLSEKLDKIRDFKLVVEWKFDSWVPFCSMVLPHDVCTIIKQGRSIRVNTNLLDIERWKRGDCSLIFSGECNQKWIAVNHKTQKYMNMDTLSLDLVDLVEEDVESKVDDLMSSDILDFEFKSSGMSMARSTSGWIWKVDKNVKIGDYQAAFYNVDNICVFTRKRREHLTEKDCIRNKAIFKTASYLVNQGKMPPKELSDPIVNINDSDNGTVGDTSSLVDKREVDQVVHRKSLPPPSVNTITWNEYLNSEPGKFPTLGRPQNLKVSKQTFKASVAMSEEFPMTKDDFIELLTIMPLKHFKRLRDFFEWKLPKGFPIQLVIPLFPVLQACVTFKEFSYINEPFQQSQFTVLPNYTEDANAFPIFGKLRNA